jgi:hypothetical protein
MSQENGQWELRHSVKDMGEEALDLIKAYHNIAVRRMEPLGQNHAKRIAKYSGIVAQQGDLQRRVIFRSKPKLAWIPEGFQVPENEMIIILVIDKPQGIDRVASIDQASPNAPGDRPTLDRLHQSQQRQDEAKTDGGFTIAAQGDHPKSMSAPKDPAAFAYRYLPPSGR